MTIETTFEYCAVEGCQNEATVMVDGRLRLNPQGSKPEKWIAVEFPLCEDCEGEHDKFHGKPLHVHPPTELDDV